ncbi:hypothetical protein ALC56_14060 [Trachymyrmex septentrionalis]|uniref:Uncharacterized protein n=1 Tax=Trachymyrmex septentrionalis TaxID=34720 RepID=A0A151JTL3_9HYME|nr:hypothetical protein ALC56_14060 [Trachymyrmex septentrionalis]
MGEQYPHSAQFAFQQELLLPISLRFGQIASATLQFVAQPAQSFLEYFLRALSRSGVRLSYILISLVEDCYNNLVLLETMQCARFLLKQSIEFVELLHFGLRHRKDIE